MIALSEEGGGPFNEAEAPNSTKQPYINLINVGNVVFYPSTRTVKMVERWVHRVRAPRVKDIGTCFQQVSPCCSFSTTLRQQCRLGYL